MSEGGLFHRRRQFGRLFDDDLPPTHAVRVLQAALALLIAVNVVASTWRRSTRSTSASARCCVGSNKARPDCSPSNGAARQGRRRYCKLAPSPAALGPAALSAGFFALIDLASSLPAIFGMLGADNLHTLRLLRMLK
jgi:hypothetical protein